MSKESEIMREHIRTHRTVLSMCNEPEDVVLNRLLDDFDSKDQRLAELEEQLKNARKETAKKVIARVEELGVFDFESYEERYIISEMELDNILKEYGE